MRVALDKDADVDTGKGSRVVIRYKGKTIGISNQGNKPYSHEYRHLVIRAFIAAGLLTLALTLYVARALALGL